MTLLLAGCGGGDGGHTDAGGDSGVFDLRGDGSRNPGDVAEDSLAGDVLDARGSDADVLDVSGFDTDAFEARGDGSDVLDAADSGDVAEGPTLGIISGTVVFPPEVPIESAKLSVVSPWASVSVTESGEFAVPVLPGGPQLVLAVAESGTPALLGYLDEEHTTLDLRSTAEALLFMTLKVGILHPDHQLQVLELLRQDEGLETLVDALGAALEGGAEGLVDSSEAVSEAIENVALSLLQAPADKPDGQFMVLIQPSERLSGLTVLNAGGLNTVQIMNEWRRRARVFIDRISYVDDVTGAVVDSFQQLVEPFAMPPVAGVGGGFIATLSDLASGTFAYEPVYSDPYELPVYPGSRKTLYHLAAVGWGAGAGDEDKLNEKQENALWAVSTETFILDVLFPSVFAIALPIKSGFDAQAIWQPVQASDRWLDLLNTVPNIPGFTAAMKAGDAWGALNVVLQYLIATKSFQDLIIGTCIDVMIDLETDGKLTPEQIESYTGFINKLGVLLNALNIANLVLAVGDEAYLIKNLMSANRADQWEIEVTPPNVKLLPKEATIELLGHVELHALIPDLEGPGGEAPIIFYHWNNTGTAGTLNDHMHVGNDFDSSSSYVLYAADLDETGTDTVTVEMFRKYKGENISLGKATATIEVQEEGVFLKPETATLEPGGNVSFSAHVLYAGSPGKTVVLKWKNSAQEGHLVEGDEHQSGTAVSTYAANVDGDGSDTVTVEAILTEDGQTKSLGTAKAVVDVVPKHHFVSLVPAVTDLMSGASQVLEAQVIPKPDNEASLLYQWSCTSLYGTMSGNADVLVPDESVTYQAAQEGSGVDLVTVNVYMALPGSNPKFIGGATAEMAVNIPECEVDPTELKDVIPFEQHLVVVNFPGWDCAGFRSIEIRVSGTLGGVMKDDSTKTPEPGLTMDLPAFPFNFQYAGDWGGVGNDNVEIRVYCKKPGEPSSVICRAGLKATSPAFGDTCFKPVYTEECTFTWTFNPCAPGDTPHCCAWESVVPPWTIEAPAGTKSYTHKLYDLSTYPPTVIYGNVYFNNGPASGSLNVQGVPNTPQFRLTMCSDDKELPPDKDEEFKTTCSEVKASGSWLNWCYYFSDVEY